MSGKRKKILLVWGYHRSDWVEVFNRIEADFDYTFLYWVFPEQDHTPIDKPVIYWSSYKSAQDLLDDVMPDKVVFLGLDTPNSIILLSVCKKRRIKTCFLQHGITNNFETYVHFLSLEAKARSQNPELIPIQNESKNNLYRFLVAFVLKSVRFYNLRSTWDIFLFQYYKRVHKMLDLQAYKKVAGKSRIPDVFIDYTRYNAQIYVERDNIDQDSVVEVGMPSMDLYFEKAKVYQTQTQSPYLLMIDQPLTENKAFNLAGYGVSRKQMNDFYLKLNTYAESVGCKLYIKLHPNSYEDDFRVEHPNIEYIRKADNPKLLLESTAVFGMFSTMMVPAVYFKPCCVFRLWEIGKFENCIEELKVAQLLDFHSFKPFDIDVLNFEKNRDDMNTFRDRYFYKADNQSAERVREVLLS